MCHTNAPPMPKLWSLDCEGLPRRSEHWRTPPAAVKDAFKRGGREGATVRILAGVPLGLSGYAVSDDLPCSPPFLYSDLAEGFCSQLSPSLQAQS
jgi:hypothetical protein